MKVLSIRQPWAWLIMTGLKDVENRTWNTDFRGRFAIHASKKFDWDALIVLLKKRVPSWITQSMIAHLGLELAETPEKSKVTESLDEFGVILGEITLVDCTKRNSSVWCDSGLYHFLLKNPIPFRKNIAAAGKLGFWNFERNVK